MTERILRTDRFIASFGIIIEEGFVRVCGGTACYITEAERVLVVDRLLSNCHGHMQLVRCMCRPIHIDAGRLKPLGGCD